MRGGFTAVACMPNTEPPLDTEASIQYVVDRARSVGFCHVLPVGTITRGREGKALAEIGAMAEAVTLCGRTSSSASSSNARVRNGPTGDALQ